MTQTQTVDKCPKCNSQNLLSYQDWETYEQMLECQDCKNTWSDEDYNNRLAEHGEESEHDLEKNALFQEENEWYFNHGYAPPN